MTEAQARFLELLIESRDLAPEVVTACRELASDDLELWQFENLVNALIDAPEREDQESFIRGVIGG